MRLPLGAQQLSTVVKAAFSSYRSNASEVTQPRFSDLMRGRIDLFSLDGLIDMAAKLGLRTRLALSRSKAA